jgi:hypothetical protein
MGKGAQLQRIRIEKALNGKSLKVSAYGKTWNTVFRVNQYMNGRIAIETKVADGEEAGEPYGILTCNLPDEKIEDGQIIVKTWSENEGLAAAALGSGLFRDTGKRIPTGFVQAQIWEVLG